MTDLPLSAGDVDRLERAITVLLSSLEYEDIDEWRVEVNRSLKALLGADMATFALPLPDREPLLNEEVDVEILRRYPAYLRALHQRLGVEDRMRGMGVWTRLTLLGDDIDLFYRSAYFNEFVTETRAYDPLGATVSIGADGDAATVYFHHASRQGRKFGARGERLLRLLFPALKAGLRSRAQLDASLHRLGVLIDTLRLPVQLVDTGGTVVHRNGAMRDLLARISHDEDIARAMKRVAEDAMAHLSGGRDLTHVAWSRPVVRDVATPTGTYRLHACLAPDLARAGTTILVSVHGEAAGYGPLPPVDMLRARLGLTKREAQVARHLAERRTNAEVADILGISPHTARHHTERVMAKLGVGSRRDVAARLRAADTD